MAPARAAPLRAEAHRLALELGRAGAEADALRVAAEALVALQRPADAVTVLAGATRADLVLLRAGARPLAGDQAALAVADARAAAGSDAMERDPRNNESIDRVKDDPAFKEYLTEKRLALPPGWR